MKPWLLPSRSLGAKEVRALAHPLRLRMLESLADDPATASMLARELGESRSATSYHLRASTPLVYLTYRALPQTPTASA